MQSHVTYIESAIYPSKQIHKKHKNNFNNYMNLAFAQWTNICFKSNNIYKAWNPFKVVRLKPALQSNLKRF